MSELTRSYCVKDEIEGSYPFYDSLTSYGRHPHYVLQMKLERCNVNTDSYVALEEQTGFEPASFNL